MVASFKALIVVIAIAALIFRVTKPIGLQFSTLRDLVLRRNVWFVLTVTAFLSPNFWLFAFVAVPVLTWARRKDTNPVALYLFLLHVIPPISIDIPVVGINTLFSIDNYRLLSFCVLIPTAWRLRRSPDPTRIRGLDWMDALLLSYGALHAVLFVPPDLPNQVLLHDSATNFLRRIFLFFVDVYALYFVVSRSCSNRRKIVEALAAFFIASATMAALSLFETAKHWLLYVDIATRWSNNDIAGFYLTRDGALRAQVSAGHALALGYLLAIAFGFWLYLQSHVNAKRSRFGVALLLWLGLLAAYSRGPLMGAVVVYLTFAALRPNAFPKLFKAAVAAILVAGVIIVSPLGDRIVKVLPFMGGSVDSGTVVYRQALARRAWELMLKNPFFGDQYAYSKMEDLRQGQGIIDLVNSYADVTVFYGLVGLSLFVGFMLIGLAKAYRMSKRVRSETDLSLLGASLVASIVGVLIMIATSSFILGLPQMFYVLGGFAAAYANLSNAPEPGPHVNVRLSQPTERR